jgi:hypothetical protein
MRMRTQPTYTFIHTNMHTHIQTCIFIHQDTSPLPAAAAAEEEEEEEPVPGSRLAS